MRGNETKKRDRSLNKRLNQVDLAKKRRRKETKQHKTKQRNKMRQNKTKKRDKTKHFSLNKMSNQVDLAKKETTKKQNETKQRKKTKQNHFSSNKMFLHNSSIRTKKKKKKKPAAKWLWGNSACHWKKGTWATVKPHQGRYRHVSWQNRHNKQILIRPLVFFALAVLHTAWRNSGKSIAMATKRPPSAPSPALKKNGMIMRAVHHMSHSLYRTNLSVCVFEGLVNWNYI